MYDYVSIHEIKFLYQIEVSDDFYLLRLNRNKYFPIRFLSAIMPPNPKCIVCSPKPEVIIKIDTNRVTVKQFRDDVLKKELNMLDPDVIIDGKGVIVISSEDDETECNNDKLLSDMKILDGCILKVDDFFQNYELTVIIVHKESEREGALFEIIADPDTLKAAEDKKEDEPIETDDTNGGSAAKKAKLLDDSDDLCVIEDDDDIEMVSSTLKNGN